MPLESIISPELGAEAMAAYFKTAPAFTAAPDKVARTNLNPIMVESVDLKVGNRALHALILGEADGFPPTEDSVVGLSIEHDADGTRIRRLLKLPRHLMESKQAVVEFYDSHEALVKGLGAVSVAGLVAAGSLFVQRSRK